MPHTQRSVQDELAVYTDEVVQAFVKTRHAMLKEVLEPMVKVALDELTFLEPESEVRSLKNSHIASLHTETHAGHASLPDIATHISQLQHDFYRVIASSKPRVGSRLSAREFASLR